MSIDTRQRTYDWDDPTPTALGGRAKALDEANRTVEVETDLGVVESWYERLVIALGMPARMLPIPGLAEYAITFKDLGDAIALRNHVLRELETAEADPGNAARYLCFVFVGAGYAGVEAIAEMGQLVIVVDPALRVTGRADIWALGDNARVPNAATPRRPDPPTCQRAVRQARVVVRSLAGDVAPYGYRSIGEGATLGRGSGIARVLGLHVRGRLGGLITRAYHVRVVPSGSRRWRILADGLLSVALRRDIVELDSLEARRVRT